MNDYHVFVVRVWTGNPERLRFQVQDLQSGEEWQCVGTATLGQLIAERVYAHAQNESPHRTTNDNEVGDVSAQSGFVTRLEAQGYKPCASTYYTREVEQ